MYMCVCIYARACVCVCTYLCVCEWEYVCVCVCACVCVYIRGHEREERERVREREGQCARELQTCVWEIVCMSPRATALETAKKRKRWSTEQAQKRRQRWVWAGVESDTVVLSGRHCARVAEKMARRPPRSRASYCLVCTGQKNAGVHAGKTQACVQALHG